MKLLINTFGRTKPSMNNKCPDCESQNTQNMECGHLFCFDCKNYVGDVIQ